MRKYERENSFNVWAENVYFGLVSLVLLVFGVLVGCKSVSILLHPSDIQMLLAAWVVSAFSLLWVIGGVVGILSLCGLVKD